MAIDRIKVKKEADRLLTAGRIERAIEEFQKLVDDNPRDYATQNQVGDLLIQIGRVRDGVEIHKRLATAYERDGFHARAAALFQKVVRNAPEDLESSQRLADLYRQMNRPADAVRIHLQVAEQFQRLGLLKRALEAFHRVVDLDPKNLKIKVRLADLYTKEGLREQAAAIYLEAAEALAMEQMHGEAAQILDRAKAMVSTPQVYLTQSRLAVIQGDHALAAQHLQEGLERHPRDSELLEALAEIQLRTGHPDQALASLAKVVQLAEKALPTCERALRTLAQGGRGAEGLQLFTPIARELARRGGGDLAGRTLRSALQDAMSVEAWELLAELAHESGQRAAQVQALQSAFGVAARAGDEAPMQRVASRLQALGVIPDASSPDGRAPGTEPAAARAGVRTEADPVLRLRIEQYAREAEALLRAGSPDRAVETYRRALELDPANLDLIQAIVGVHRATGRLTQVQMQYVQSAQALAGLGRAGEATHLMDLADQLFPGSTRIHRRALGLPEAGSTPPPPPPAPAQDPGPIPPGERLDPGTGLPPDPFSPSFGGGAAPGDTFDGLPLTPLPVPDPGTPPPPFPPEAEPLDFRDLPEAPLLPAAPLPPELEGLLGDIDFQLDYGSPEEAKLEIEAALAQFPGHPELTDRLARAALALQRLGRVLPSPVAETPDSSVFDLSDLLGTALTGPAEGSVKHDATHRVEKVESVEELFEAFREGVQRQVQGDDYDTHYNLGIGYKEMQLLEPAIEEFKVAMGDPERTLECCSMLSLCELARGNPEAAAAWLLKGIQAPGFPPEDAIGLLYDLAELHLSQGRPREASDLYRSVAALDPGYRDVAARLR